MEELYNITGTLETDQIVHLDRPISLPVRRVRIILQPLISEQRTGKTLIKWIKMTRADLKKRGYYFRSKEAIDQQINDERESWGD